MIVTGHLNDNNIRLQISLTSVDSGKKSNLLYIFHRTEQMSMKLAMNANGNKVSKSIMQNENVVTNSVT